jgi:hypothetical protein
MQDRSGNNPGDFPPPSGRHEARPERGKGSVAPKRLRTRIQEYLVNFYEYGKPAMAFLRSYPVRSTQGGSKRRYPGGAFNVRPIESKPKQGLQSIYPVGQSHGNPNWRESVYRTKEHDHRTILVASIASTRAAAEALPTRDRQSHRSCPVAISPG